MGSRLDKHHVPETNGRMPVCRRCGARTDGPKGLHIPDEGQLERALTLAQRAKQLLPDLAEVTDTLGWIYLKKYLTDNAIAAFDEIVRKQPVRSTYRYHLGMA